MAKAARSSLFSSLWVLAFLTTTAASRVHAIDEGCHAVNGAYGAPSSSTARTFDFFYQLEWWSEDADYHLSHMYHGVFDELTQQLADGLVKRFFSECQPVGGAASSSSTWQFMVLDVPAPTAVTATSSCHGNGGNGCLVLPAQLKVVSINNSNNNNINSLVAAITAALEQNSPLIIHGTAPEGGLQVFTWRFDHAHQGAQTYPDAATEKTTTQEIVVNEDTMTIETTEASVSVPNEQAMTEKISEGVAQDEPDTAAQDEEMHETNIVEKNTETGLESVHDDKSTMMLFLSASLFIVIAVLYCRYRARAARKKLDPSGLIASHHYNSDLSLQQLLRQLPNAGQRRRPTSCYKRVAATEDEEDDMDTTENSDVSSQDDEDPEMVQVML